MKLPAPSWLTLQEAIAWLVEQGVPDTDTKSGLLRAFRNDEVRTRARSRKYTGHDTQTKLNGIAWDRARVDWVLNGFAIPDEKGWAIDFSDVEVFRDDLANWVNNASASTPTEAEGAPSRRGRKREYDWDALPTPGLATQSSLNGNRPEPAPDRRYSKAALRAWYEQWVMDHAKDERPPSREDDWAAACNSKRFGGGVPRDAVRALRRELAPAKWKEGGHPKPGGRKPGGK